MATDKNGKVVLFSGAVWSGGPPGDTWLFGSSADTTPPQITVPADVSVPATSPTGATVTYTATATDDTDPSPAVSCTPPPGSVLVIGMTTVVCHATDASGNSASANFTVRVSGAAEQLADLHTAVTGVGSGRALADKVGDAQRQLAGNHPKNACHKLDDFIHHVNDQLKAKKITAPQAESFIARARNIKATLGCSND